MPTKKTYRNPNGYGSITKLSGKRRRPYMLKVNTCIDDRGYPLYDILGYFDERPAAIIALAEYSKNPYDIDSRKITFREVYEQWFKRKYESGIKKYSKDSVACTKGAFKKVAALHTIPFTNIKTAHMQEILDTSNLSHAYAEHVKNLFTQLFKYAMEYDIVEKNYAQFVRINLEEDDQAGVPFTPEEIKLLWQHKDAPYIDSILIFLYSGWRITELLTMPLSDIDLTEQTFKGSIKTASSKNRIVPIHSKIYDLVCNRYHEGTPGLFCLKNKALSKPQYYKLFNNALISAGISTKHTPHDCLHTFTTLLDNAGASPICIDRLVGHASKSLTSKVYTHKDIDQLRIAIEMI